MPRAFLPGLSRQRNQGNYEWGELGQFEVGELVDTWKFGDRAERDLAE
jgi:hypothetical protein